MLSLLFAQYLLLATVSYTLFSVASTTTTTTTRFLARHHEQHLHFRQDSELATMAARRLVSIKGDLNVSVVGTWLTTQLADGSWPDVNYTTGCDARRANWPAQEHWLRTLTLAGAWHGLANGDSFVQNPTVRTAISNALDWWAARDFTNPACLNQGGFSPCPCGTPGLWNTNWYGSVIGVPLMSGKACLLMGNALTSPQRAACAKMTTRSYATLDGTFYGLDPGVMTGANLLDAAGIGIDEGLLTSNATRIDDAYRRIHTEAVILNTLRADGIRADGSFGQHSGVLYNGNYGAVYAATGVQLELLAAGTRFAAGTPTKTALSAYFGGSQWMVIRNTIANTTHWDLSVVGRFISFPIIDKMANGPIQLKSAEINRLGQQWSTPTLTQFALMLNLSDLDANAGSLLGNRMFYANDYMVHRGANYVTSLKMFSSRTQNTECVNTQNPFGFHLSDGALHTYLNGNEYTDIAAAWDWNLIPGITTDYGNTPLSCANTERAGIDKFAGGVSDGTVGIAAMRYNNSITASLRWQKTWFFLDDDVQHVLVNNITSKSSAPKYTVLDQRNRAGSVVVDGTDRTTALADGTFRAFSSAKAIWHGGVGYALDGASSTTLTVRIGRRSGSWSTIGTSTQPPINPDLYTAYLNHNNLNAISYSIFPAITSYSAFITKKDARPIQTVQNNGSITAIFDANKNKAYLVFWDSKGGSVSFSQGFTVTSNGKAAIIYNRATGSVTVSDPMQASPNVVITIGTKSLTFDYPQGGLAGSSVTKTL